MSLAGVRGGRDRLPLDNDIVFFCDCPNEASAAYAAKGLMDLGYTRVRPLLGGLDAWIAAGYELEKTAP
jgi:rhodanese-related sulfurtransferase